MKKRPALRLAALLMAIMLCLSGCGKYKSSYLAVGFVHSNTAASAFMDFYQFEGRMVFTLKGQGQSDWRIRYTAKLESGGATISYVDEHDQIIEVRAVAAGDEIDAVLGDFDRASVTIIVETSQQCRNGSFHFDRE